MLRAVAWAGEPIPLPGLAAVVALAGGEDPERLVTRLWRSGLLERVVGRWRKSFGMHGLLASLLRSLAFLLVAVPAHYRSWLVGTATLLLAHSVKGGDSCPHAILVANNRRSGNPRLSVSAFSTAQTSCAD